MQYDLIIKNGTVIDGSGLPRFRADVGVLNGKIASIGRIRAEAKETIDATMGRFESNVPRSAALES